MKVLSPEAFVPGEVRKFLYWIQEREAVRVRKEQGLPRPWSTDPYLDRFRWCNVVRMDDRVSRWLLAWHRNHTYSSPSEAVLACALGRLINWPDTLAALPPPIPFDSTALIRALSKRALKGEKIFTGAYIINGAYGGPKYLQIVERILTPLWEHPPEIDTSSMEATWSALRGRPGLGSFMAGQIVADLRHVYPGEWTDRYEWAPLGPGSTRGLARLRGTFRVKRVFQHEEVPMMVDLLKIVRRELPKIAERMELHDVQNCCCEFDKYRRLQLSQGSVRSVYRPHLP